MSQRGVIEDPDYPGLFYHILGEGREGAIGQTGVHTFALSFLDRVPDSHFLASQDGRQAGESIIGWCRAAQDDMASGVGSDSGSPLTSAAFQENPRFLRVLHSVIKATIESNGDEETRTQAIHAQSLGSTWCHISDMRNPPPFGRIPFPDDILGTVAIQGPDFEGDRKTIDIGNGVKMVLDSYQPMPSYRLVSENKMMQLTDSMMRALLRRLRNGIS